jgi:hypothetical protein
MSTKFNTLLENAESLPDIFEVVKAAVWRSIGRSRAGLMLGMADLGNQPQGFFGAFFTVGSNVIVMNKIPINRIKETRPELYKPYAFHVLLHEYLHSLGYLDENVVRQDVYEISLELFGKNHLTTKIAENTHRFFPNLTYPDMAWQPEELNIELVDGFDRSSIHYIS